MVKRNKTTIRGGRKAIEFRTSLLKSFIINYLQKENYNKIIVIAKKNNDDEWDVIKDYSVEEFFNLFVDDDIIDYKKRLKDKGVIQDRSHYDIYRVYIFCDRDIVESTDEIIVYMFSINGKEYKINVAKDILKIKYKDVNIGRYTIQCNEDIVYYDLNYRRYECLNMQKIPLKLNETTTVVDKYFNLNDYILPEKQIVKLITVLRSVQNMTEDMIQKYNMFLKKPFITIETEGKAEHHKTKNNVSFYLDTYETISKHSVCLWNDPENNDMYDDNKLKQLFKIVDIKIGSHIIAENVIVCLKNFKIGNNDYNLLLLCYKINEKRFQWVDLKGEYIKYQEGKYIADPNYYALNVKKI